MHFLLWAQTLTLIAGVVVSASLALHVIVPFLVRHARWTTWLPRLLDHVAATSNVRGESLVKFASTRKLNRLLVNADVLHGLDSRENDRRALLAKRSTKRARRKVTDETMRNYVLNGSRKETIGGFYWTWRRLIDMSLLADEGLWINSRLIVFQTCQLVAAIAFAYLLLWSVGAAADGADEAREDLETNNVPQWVDDLIPTGEMVKRSLYPAAVIAIIVSFLLILLYIPRCAECSFLMRIWMILVFAISKLRMYTFYKTRSPNTTSTRATGVGRSFVECT